MGDAGDLDRPRRAPCSSPVTSILMPTCLRCASSFAGRKLLAVGVVSTIDWGLLDLAVRHRALPGPSPFSLAATLILPNIKMLNLGKSAGTALADIHDDYLDPSTSPPSASKNPPSSSTPTTTSTCSAATTFPKRIPSRRCSTPLASNRGPRRRNRTSSSTTAFSARIRKEHPALRIYPIRHFNGINWIVEAGLRHHRFHVVLPKFTFVPTTTTAPATLPVVAPRP